MLNVCPEKRGRAGVASRGLLGVFVLVAGLGCSGWGGGGTQAPPAPSFTLTAGDGTLQLPAGGSGFVLVAANRVNGCTGDIVLSVPGLPTGVVASGTILNGSASGALCIIVDPGVNPQVLGGLSVEGQLGALQRSASFRLTVAAPLPASDLSPDLVNASGGLQSGGIWNNTGVAMEPLSHALATNSFGADQVRSGFLPVSTPNLP